MSIREFTCLVGDIGVVSTRLHLFRVTKAREEVNMADAAYKSKEFNGLISILKIFLKLYSPQKSPEVACFSITGPVTGGKANIPLLGWIFNAENIETELGIGRVQLLNNYECIANGIEYIPDEQMYELTPGVPAKESGTKIVIGAGMGLGQAIIFTYPDGKVKVIAGEGGHGDFAPKTPIEFSLMQFIKKKLRINRVSIERVVSGFGLDSIYSFLANEDPALQNSELSEQIRDSAESPGAVVARHALAGSDVLCEKAMKLFLAIFGSEAGNLALSVLPAGGVYITGGLEFLVPMRQHMENEFMDGFVSKGRMRRLMVTFPVRLILSQSGAIMGAKSVAMAMQRDLAQGESRKGPARVQHESVFTLRQKCGDVLAAAGQRKAAESGAAGNVLWMAAGVAVSGALIGAFLLGVMSGDAAEKR